MAKLLVALALCGSASAYVAPVASSKAATQLAGAKDEVVDLALSNTDALGASLGFWDPLGVTNADFWGLGNEGTIGYLRHAEIKHGRIAMAGFLGFIAGCTPLVSGEHAVLPYRGYVAGVTPQEQWDNIPQAGKLQIFALVGMSMLRILYWGFEPGTADSARTEKRPERKSTSELGASSGERPTLPRHRADAPRHLIYALPAT